MGSVESRYLVNPEITQHFPRVGRSVTGARILPYDGEIIDLLKDPGLRKIFVNSRSVSMTSTSGPKGV